MKIKIWGCRGSLPTPGKNTIEYGGNTTCLEVRLDDGTIIIIDAGSGLRNLGKQLLKEPEINELYLLLTHSHWDHLMGFPFFIPAYIEKYKIHVKGGSHAKRSLKKFLAHQMEAPYFPVPFKALKAKIDFVEGNPIEMTIGSAKIIPVELNHPNGGYGFKIIENGKNFIFLTDNELDLEHDGERSFYEYQGICKNADLLIHDAQYTEREYEKTKGWGHSTFDNATNLAIKSQVKKFGIFHHDPDHSDKDMNNFENYCKQIIENDYSNIECFIIKEGMEIIL